MFQPWTYLLTRIRALGVGVRVVATGWHGLDYVDKHAIWCREDEVALPEVLIANRCDNLDLLAVAQALMDRIDIVDFEIHDDPAR